MKTDNTHKATLANIRLIRRRAELRSAGVIEDLELESSIMKDVGREIESRIAAQSRNGSIVTRALIDGAKSSGKPTGAVKLAESWHETSVYCEEFADFHERRYGRSSEYYLRMKERAATLRECIKEILLSH